MNGEGNDRARLINAAIEASIEFEKLMDKTDFDSWLDTDSPETFKKWGQLVGPFINYKNNEKKLKEIYYQMKREVINNSSNFVRGRSHIQTFLFKAQTTGCKNLLRQRG
jgi:hypothetical protein